MVKVPLEVSVELSTMVVAYGKKTLPSITGGTESTSENMSPFTTVEPISTVDPAKLVLTSPSTYPLLIDIATPVASDTNDPSSALFAPSKVKFISIATGPLEYIPYVKMYPESSSMSMLTDRSTVPPGNECCPTTLNCRCVLLTAEISARKLLPLLRLIGGITIVEPS